MYYLVLDAKIIAKEKSTLQVPLRKSTRICSPPKMFNEFF